MAQKITAGALTVIAGSLAWREFGPRAYKITWRNTTTGRSSGEIRMIPCHPAFIGQKINDYNDSLEKDGNIVTDVKRIH